MNGRGGVVRIVASLLLLGCSDPLSVKELAGSYSLVGMDARALPQLLSATLSCDEWVRGGDLILQESGAFTLMIRGDLDCTRAGGEVQTIGWEFPGNYSVSGTTLQFVSPIYPSGELQFRAALDPLRARIRIADFELHVSRIVDLEFRR